MSAYNFEEITEAEQKSAAAWDSGQCSSAVLTLSMLRRSLSFLSLLSLAVEPSQSYPNGAPSCLAM